MDQPKGTAPAETEVMQGEQLPGDAAPIGDGVPTDVAPAVDAMLTAVNAANAANAEPLESPVTSASTTEDAASPGSETAVKTPTVFDPASVAVATDAEVSPTPPAINLAEQNEQPVSESPAQSESIAARVEDMVTQAAALNSVAEPVADAGVQEDATGIETTPGATTPNAAAGEKTKSEVALTGGESVQAAEAPSCEATAPPEVKATTPIDVPSKESTPAASRDSTTEAQQDAAASPVPQQTETVAGAERPTTQGAETAVAKPADGASPVMSSSEEEAFGDFESADAIITQAKQAEEEAAAAEREKAAATAAESLKDLDTALAHEAEKTLNAEDSGEAPSAGSHTSKAAAGSSATPVGGSVAAEKANKKNAGGAAEVPVRSDAAREKNPSHGTHGESGTQAADSEPHTPKPKSAAFASIRRAAKPASRIVMKGLVPLATRYERVGAANQKILKMVAVGTIVQAAALWGYLLFGRTVDQAAIEAAANAKEGAIHPVAASLPGMSHGAGHGAADGHGDPHGTSQDATPGHAPSHEAAPAPHAADKDHDEHGASVAPAGHGH